MDINENKYKIVFTKNCKLEMDSIYSYITNQLYNEIASKKLMQKVEKSIQILNTMPFSHPVIKKYKELAYEYRRIVVNNYVVIYTVSEIDMKVYIIHMYYGGSNYLKKI